ncbi:Gamma-glutamyl-gamma-aminobutyrate hydrolase PuuD [Pseudomonas fluorescens]|uniref:gamma-glutamyl-gamma-aminobutyrate hydrolase family protein n=1 Tax=Pseudomonas fluorescens TaxID=294 RepID=UPI00125B1C88|nr:gamma-glutamyl-gamma-aminobutyrate hydrolase family protein [Pseudomonas fluorescens]CAG8865217.1 Gamma-glutamyl-gamma-aminobutyrate hydrolase PuuD [Pseudomonas fluorescens]VVQ05761.1 Gamma-glutamyl-gamma-aminobutyrate hydrolase PuuD [Pseudomonas fluorescens]
MSRLPIIGVSACSWKIGPHAVQINDDKYSRAVATAAKCLPVIIPLFPELLTPAELIDGLDGLLFTGSPSNIEPHHYDGPPSPRGTQHDAARDHLALPLWRAAVEAGVPVLGICRGFQELNVAFGGTLHQQLDGPGAEHEPPSNEPVEDQYAPAHAITVRPGGMLERLGLSGVIEVNSVHGQGIARVGQGLRIEAVAEDGLVEGLSVEGSKAFALGVQWHPEWQVMFYPDYLAIFQAFGDACRKRAEQRAAAG